MSSADANANELAPGDRSAKDQAPAASGSLPQHPLHPSIAERAAVTLGVWLVAFVVVMALFLAGGDELERQPLPVRVLVLTGVMVILMMHVVGPVMSRVVRRFTSRSTPRSTARPQSRGSSTSQRR